MEVVHIPLLKKHHLDHKSEEGDIEARFEANRWRFLCEELWEVGAERQLALVRVRTWIEQHQIHDLEAWETYSASERVANLLIWLSCSGLADDEMKAKNVDLYLFVSKSLKWIAEHLEYYGEQGTNNHILNNARALVMGGISINDSESFHRGMETFRVFLPRMVGRAGFLRERSSHYQLIVANWILDAWYFADACLGASDLDTVFLRDYAERMAAAVMMLCDENGNLQGLIGDISPDAHPLFSLSRLHYLYQDILKKSARQKATYPEIADDWFFLQDGNHSIMGNFPTGQFPPIYPTHGHCDYTGFIWRTESISILSDSGRYRYTPDNVSLMQKSALGHSIPLVNGFAPMCESMLQNGMWWPRPYASANLLLEAYKSGVKLSHDGFARATPVDKHIRQICMVSDGIEIVDHFSGHGLVQVQIRWNFGPDFVAFDPDHYCVLGPNVKVELDITGFDGNPTFRVLRQEPAGGWYSDAYAVKTASLTLVVEGMLSLTASIKTRFEIINVRNSWNH